jgi:hypothetical protein
MFELGQQIELVYPVETDVIRIRKAPRRLRQLQVYRVRDLLEEPLSVEEFARRPYVARSRWLILARDIASRAFRQFYPGSADNYRSPDVLQIGLYEPGESRPAMLLGRQFEATPEDRNALLRLAIREQNRHEGYELKIFASGLRLIS